MHFASSTCSEVPDEVYRNLDGIGGDDDKWWEVIPLRFSIFEISLNHQT